MGPETTRTTVTSGWFEVGDEVTRAGDIGVVHCRHLPAHRTYLMRRPITGGPPGDGALADNAETEIVNVRTTAVAAAKLYPGRYWGTDRLAQEPDYMLREYYGVLDGCYLVPVSAIYRVRGAMPFEALLRISPARVQGSGFWEDLWLLLASETGLLASGSLPLEEWDERWRYLVCGSALGRRLVEHLPAGTPERLTRHVWSCVRDDSLGPGPAFEESMVARLLMGTAISLFGESEVEASLVCPFFRVNVAIHDLHYAVALNRLLAPRRWLLQSPIQWLGQTLSSLPTVLRGLLVQPVALPQAGERFEQVAAPDDEMVSRFRCFVQDPELIGRPYLALARGPE
jgi:hypothetical protein